MTDTIKTNERMSMAGKIKKLPAIDIPKLDAWNYGPCEHHDLPKPDCEYQACGGDLFDHQKVTTSWLYLVKNGMVASLPGTGKTNIILSLLSLLKQKNELPRRALLITSTPVVPQWLKEFKRFAPGLNVEGILPATPKSKRISKYTSTYDVLVVGQHAALKDADLLKRVEPGVFITDDVDAILSHKTKIHKLVCAIAEQADRVVTANATIYRTNVLELHAAMQPIGGKYLFGPLKFFEDRYAFKKWESVDIGGGRRVNTSSIVGVKNGLELREKIDPWIIRHTYDDIEDVRVPDVTPPTEVWLDVHPEQRARYKELQQGILRRRQEGKEEEVREIAAIAAYNLGGSILSGLPALGEADGVGKSAKLDWLERTIRDEWENEKVIVFIRNVGLVKALQARLTSNGIKYATIWGGNKDSVERQAEVKRFWEDPDCRIIIGTSAMVRSLNLQVARIVCFVDLPGLTPANVTQALGRVRRAGSKFAKIFPFVLLSPDSQESRYLEVLQGREAVSNFLWDDESTAVFEKLSPSELLHLIAP